MDIEKNGLGELKLIPSLNDCGFKRSVDSGGDIKVVENPKVGDCGFDVDVSINQPKGSAPSPSPNS